MAISVASSEAVFLTELDELQLKSQTPPLDGEDIIATVDHNSLRATDESYLLQGGSRVLEFGVADAGNPYNWPTVSI